MIIEVAIAADDGPSSTSWKYCSFPGPALSEALAFMTAGQTPGATYIIATIRTMATVRASVKHALLDHCNLHVADPDT